MRLEATRRSSRRTQARGDIESKVEVADDGRSGGGDRLKRLTLLVRGDRRICGALYPNVDPAGSVLEVHVRIDALERRAA